MQKILGTATTTNITTAAVSAMFAVQRQDGYHHGIGGHFFGLAVGVDDLLDNLYYWSHGWTTHGGIFARPISGVGYGDVSVPSTKAQ